jgi:fructokinase
MATNVRIGIDFGGTKIEIIALARDGSAILRRRVANPRSYEAALLAVAGLVSAAEAELGMRCSVGVGIPGAISPETGVVLNANSTWMNGRAFDRDLGAALGREIRVENDANCFALSEAADGAAAGKTVVFGVILGTGCGGGIVVGGRVIAGLHRVGARPGRRCGRASRAGAACRPLGAGAGGGGEYRGSGCDRDRGRAFQHDTPVYGGA